MKAIFNPMISKTIFLTTLLFYQTSSYNVFSESASNDIKNRILANTSQPEKITPSPSYSYDGKWKIVEAYIDEEEVQIPSDYDIILTLKESISENNNVTSYLFLIKAFNSFGGDLTVLGNDEFDGFDNIEVGDVMGTEAYPPKKFLEIESFISKELSEMDKMMVGTYDEEDDHILVMKNDDAILLCEWIPPPPAYEGTWKLVEAYNDGEKVDIPRDDVLLRFVGNSRGYQYILHVTAFNIFQTIVEIISRNIDNEFDEIQVGRVASTKKKPSSQFEDVEKFLTTGLVDMDRMKIYENDDEEMLMMKSGNTKLYCVRFETLPYEGTWKLVKAFDDDGRVKFPESADITLEFTKSDEMYDYELQANVYNVHATYVDVFGRNENDFDKIAVAPVKSTRMEPPDELKDIDDFFATSLSSFEKMKSYKIKYERELIMKGSNGHIYCQWVE